MKLSKIRSRDKALPDLLNFATVIRPGVVLCKDGALISGFYYRGEDYDSITNVERNAISARLNDKFKILGTGWTLTVDAVRVSSTGYPDREHLHFPDPITRLIDEERRKQYEQEKGHFETVYAMTITYLPPLLAESKLEQLIYASDEQHGRKNIADKILEDFGRGIEEVQVTMGDILHVERMTDYVRKLPTGKEVAGDVLVEYLNWCVCGDYHPITLSKNIPYLDGILGNYDLIGGIEPMIDNKHISVIAITGFPMETYPGMLAILDAIPCTYRWSSRFIYMDGEDAKKELQKYRRRWKQKERGLLDQVFQTNRSGVDRDAVEMTMETESAMADANSQLVMFGFYTNTIILQSSDKDEIQEEGRRILRQVRNLGFAARVETVNSMEAWLGSIPGHSYLNIRRPVIHTMNLTDLLPLSSIWAGRANNPNPMYPKNSPALIYTDTTGATTFRLNAHVGDLGHTLIFGPTGSGKSTLLAMLAAQFRKYAGATFYGFDKGYSLFCLTKAVTGQHHDIASEDSKLQFAPLASIHTDLDQVWAETWTKSCCELQLNEKLTPEEKQEIHRSMTLHRHGESKTITEFVSNLQSKRLREALNHYTVNGSMGHLLDAEEDSLNLSDFDVFEMEYLMEYPDEDKLPVLLYIFNRIEKSLRGQPAMIILDEAWVMLGHPVFREKIREWLKVLRKNNCFVVMATQSLSDAERSEILDVLIESCPTKIFLPNSAAKSEAARGFYERIGLNEAQIDIVSAATPKRQYYQMSDEGVRLFELALGDVALSFAAQSGKKSRDSILQYCRSYGDTWPYRWMQDRRVNYHQYQH